MATVAEGGLQHEVLPEPGVVGELGQMRVVLHLRQRVGHRWHACLVADAHGLDLVVDPVAQLRSRKPDLAADLLGELFGLLVEHEKDQLGLAATALDMVDDLLVLEEIVVDVLDRLKLVMRDLIGHENIRMAAVIAV